MIQAKKSRFFDLIFKPYHLLLLRKHFYRIHINGEENFMALENSSPVIMFANHSNWWDGFIAYFLSSKRWKLDDYLMMDIEQMKKYSFFRKLGVFSIDRANAREAVKTIEYASSLLQNSNRVLWIFPQGIIQIQDYRPIEFFSGITNLAGKLNRVNLLPVAIRYEFVSEQRPEIFIRLGTPFIIHSRDDIPSGFTDILRDRLIIELDTLREDVIENKTGEYEIIFKGKESRNKTVDDLL